MSIIKKTESISLTTSYVEISIKIPKGTTSVALWLSESDSAETISAFVSQIDGVATPQAEGDTIQPGEAWTPFWGELNTPLQNELTIKAKATSAVTAFLQITMQ